MARSSHVSSTLTRLTFQFTFCAKVPNVLGIMFVLPEIYSNGDMNFHILTDITCYRYRRTKIDRRTKIKSGIAEHVTVVDYRVRMAAKVIGIQNGGGHERKRQGGCETN